MVPLVRIKLRINIYFVWFDLSNQKSNKTLMLLFWVKGELNIRINQQKIAHFFLPLLSFDHI